MSRNVDLIFDQASYVCREGHWHDGVRGHDGAKCPEEKVSDLMAQGLTMDEAVEKVYGDTDNG